MTDNGMTQSRACAHCCTARSTLSYRHKQSANSLEIQFVQNYIASDPRPTACCMPAPDIRKSPRVRQYFGACAATTFPTSCAGARSDCMHVSGSLCRLAKSPIKARAMTSCRKRWGQIAGLALSTSSMNSTEGLCVSRLTVA
jgi:hypothetical protein